MRRLPPWVNNRTGAGGEISPAMDDFCITPVDGEPVMPVQSPYTASQLRNYSPTLPRIILPPIKLDGHFILNVCTPAGSIESWVVTGSLGKPELIDTRQSGSGDLCAPGVNPRTRQNIKIGDGNKRLKSKMIAIKDPHGEPAQGEGKEAAGEGNGGEGGCWRCAKRWFECMGKKKGRKQREMQMRKRSRRRRRRGCAMVVLRSQCNRIFISGG
ncbi:hypothetical protein HOY80DRAFT_1133011 [Tuber brumale]|nr:hypothetical protein HOY80DRAFT_1133011 [Tuber brumale]